SLNAKTLLKVGQCPRLAWLRTAGHCPPTERVGAVDEGKGGKDRTRLAERKMNAGHAAPLHAIVHAWQIVEDQRRRVEVFERNGQVFGWGLMQAVRRGHLKDHPWADEDAGIIEHMTERFLEWRVEGNRNRQVGPESIR